MTSEEYRLLFEKYLDGRASPEEVDIIMSYQDQFEYSEFSSEDHMRFKDIQSRILMRLNSSIKVESVSKIRNIRWWAYAAAVALLAITFYQNYKAKPLQNGLAQKIAFKNDIAPGSATAILTLSNGRTIVLNQTKNETVINQNNSIITKTINGLIQYETLAGFDSNNSIEYNTVSTAKGGQYIVVLPDGTKVWLNAASSLKFPTAFIGSERKVELTGEGYFEVAKDKSKPFKVEFNKQEVTVLGTHFDIMAYNDEEQTATTLLEGSVKISKGNVLKVLHPGEQAISLNTQNTMSIQQGKIDEVMAWKNGYFLFKDANIQLIMRQIARWYNVDVTYVGNLQDKVYGGRVSKSKNISEILNNLELTGTIHFKIEGRRVTVME